MCKLLYHISKHTDTYLFVCLIACYALYYFVTFSKKYIVTRTAIGFREA